MMVARGLILLVAGLALVAGERVRYDGYRVYRVLPADENQLEFLGGLRMYHGDIRFWKDSRAVDMPADVMVSPKMQATFTEWLQENSIKAYVFIDNVQKLIDNERTSKAARADFAVDQYHSLDEINAWMASLEETYPGTVRVIELGQSYYGSQLGVEINFGESNGVVLLEGAMHCSEWIATACMNWFINEIITTNDSDVREVINQFKFHIMPSSNPDGYNYTWTTDRLWSKNRRPNGDCVGVNLDLNYPFNFTGYGTSDDPCSDEYPGPEPFSEVESSTFSQTLAGYQPGELMLYGSFHSYGQNIMFPFGVPGNVASNYDELLGMAQRASEASAARYGTSYTFGSVVDLVPAESGSSIDWMQSVIGFQYNFGWQLRDQGEYGFLLPEELIAPTCQETFDSVVSLLRDRLSGAKASVQQQP